MVYSLQNYVETKSITACFMITSCQLGKSKERKIIVSKDGPYFFSGDIPLSVEIITNNKEGYSWDWKKGKIFETKSEYAHCRCGACSNKQFWDGSHTSIKFYDGLVKNR